MGKSQSKLYWNCRRCQALLGECVGRMAVFRHKGHEQRVPLPAARFCRRCGEQAILMGPELLDTPENEPLRQVEAKAMIALHMQVGTNNVITAGKGSSLSRSLRDLPPDERRTELILQHRDKTLATCELDRQTRLRHYTP